MSSGPWGNQALGGLVARRTPRDGQDHPQREQLCPACETVADRCGRSAVTRFSPGDRPPHQRRPGWRTAAPEVAATARSCSRMSDLDHSATTRWDAERASLARSGARMRPPRAVININRFVIEVSCLFGQTRLLLDPGRDLPAQVTTCNLAHRARCGWCDTSQVCIGRFQQHGTE